MPTYQYRCTECGHDLEAVQKFTDAALTECPSCGGPLRKVFNAVGVVFKGSGFYRNDSRSADKGAGGDGGGEQSSNGKESSAPAKEKTGAGEKNGSAGKDASARPAPAVSANGSSASSSTPAKAAGS